MVLKRHTSTINGRDLLGYLLYREHIPTNTLARSYTLCTHFKAQEKGRVRNWALKIGIHPLYISVTCRTIVINVGMHVQVINLCLQIFTMMG